MGTLPVLLRNVQPLPFGGTTPERTATRIDKLVTSSFQSPATDREAKVLGSVRTSCEEIHNALET